MRGAGRRDQRGAGGRIRERLRHSESRLSLQLQAGGILKGSTNLADYPIISGRIAGAFQLNPMVLVNATNNNSSPEMRTS